MTALGRSFLFPFDNESEVGFSLPDLHRYRVGTGFFDVMIEQDTILRDANPPFPF